MSRIAIPTRDEAPSETHPILDAVGKQLGFVPNLHRLMSISPAVLTGWVALGDALNTTLDLKTRDAIALAISQANGCDYCLSGHTYLSTTFAKTPLEEIALNRQGRSSDPKRDAAVHFAQAVLETRGQVSAADLAAVRQASFSDREIIEIVALSAQYLLANFINNVADADIDFPPVSAAQAAA